MPDGDVVHHGVSRRYASAYKELCEGYFDDEHIAGKVAKALRKSLKSYGNQPISLVTQTVADVSNAVTSGIAIDASQESYLIDQIARELMGHRRGTPLAVDACKECVMRASNGTANTITVSSVIRSYVTRVLDADFYQHLPLLNHHNGASPEAVEQRLQQIRPYLDVEIECIVGQIAKTGRVNGLRKARRDSTLPEPDFGGMDISIQSRWQDGNDDDA